MACVCGGGVEVEWPIDAYSSAETGGGDEGMLLGGSYGIHNVFRYRAQYVVCVSTVVDTRDKVLDTVSDTSVHHSDNAVEHAAQHWEQRENWCRRRRM